MSTAQHNSLSAAGFNPEQIDGLYALWGNDLIEPLITVDAFIMRGLGFDPADTYDAVRHQLDGYVAAIYLRNGFTAHQAHMVENTPRAQAVLHARGHNAFEAFLANDAPRAFLINVLLVALSPGEADAYVARYATAHAAAPSDTPFVVDEVAMLAGQQNPEHSPSPVCDCGPVPA